MIAAPADARGRPLHPGAIVEVIDDGIALPKGSLWRVLALDPDDSWLDTTLVPLVPDASVERVILNSKHLAVVQEGPVA